MRPIRSRDNALVKHLHALATSARERRKTGETVLDGPHLIAAALDHAFPLKRLVVAETALQRGEVAALLARAPAEIERICLDDALSSHVSPVDTPSGIVALIDTPRPPDGAGHAEFSGDVVVLDGVQDPGNLGTILRTAAAAGVADALLTEGCAQAWSPRVLRAGMGAHFVLRIREQADALALLAGFPGPRLATALAPGARSLYELDLAPAAAWMFGAEGQGLSPALLSAADGLVTIPMGEGVESLNVGAAAAICLFEQRRQRLARTAAGR
ncbi:TrmH family RNA methyltransferase [Thauera sinica]|uniref:TrmH family RNA methyltransferase n=1 Tax=Thauera sinica TaxID=2665146 RepID=A0ABW1AUA1_9RHOO|nr:RNA methyltransferase [Thauera sp. K11]ATE60004.1 rRNA methyltransferase [Thauera sp. K11]